MTISMHAASIPVFQQMLRGLSNVLTKAAAFAEEKKFDPSVLVQARLYPDMFPLSRQVQIACDFAKGMAARLAGVDVPAYEDHEQTLDELQQRIAKTLAFIASIDPALFEGSEQREIVRGKPARQARLTETRVELPQQPKSASFFTVQGQDSAQAAE